jgi:hypothetical protein
VFLLLTTQIHITGAGHEIVQTNELWSRQEHPRNGDQLLFAERKHILPVLLVAPGCWAGAK